jgi:hypothetical protein
VNSISDLKRRLLGIINPFISKDNPSSHATHTRLAIRLPVPPRSRPNAFVANQSLSGAG